MQRFQLLISLPSRLSCIILQDWLTLKSVVKLDSAYCCRSHRVLFVELVQSDEYYICEQVTITNKSKILSVLPKFGKKLRSVVFANRLASELERRLLEHCQNLTRVRFLDCNSCTYQLWGIVDSKVIWLDLSGADVNNLVLLQIPQKCPKLVSLGLADGLLSEDVLQTITHACSHIVHLDIARNNVTDAGILSTVTNLKSLRGLNIEGCTRLTDASLVHIYTHCAGTLHTLQLDTRKVDDFSTALLAPALSVSVIVVLLEHCTQLRTLHLAKDVKSRSAFIKIPSAVLQNLTTLVMGKSVCIDGTSNTCKHRMNLRTLTTDYFYRIGALAHLAQGCPSLRGVYLKTCILDAKFRLSVLEYAVGLTDILKEARPGVAVHCIESWEESSAHYVMSL